MTDALTIPTDPASEPQAVTKRDAAGRFLKGTAAGPGRPKGVDARQAFIEKFGEADAEATVADVIKSMAAMAIRGDAAAARVLLDRLCGPADSSVFAAAGVVLRVVTGADE